MMCTRVLSTLMNKKKIIEMFLCMSYLKKKKYPKIIEAKMKVKQTREQSKPWTIVFSFSLTWNVDHGRIFEN